MNPEGVFLAAGGPVLPGVSVAPSIYDIAPTVLALLGMPVPDDMPGRVIEEIVEPAFWAEHQTAGRGQRSRGWSDETGLVLTVALRRPDLWVQDPIWRTAAVPLAVLRVLESRVGLQLRRPRCTPL